MRSPKVINEWLSEHRAPLLPSEVQGLLTTFQYDSGTLSSNGKVMICDAVLSEQDFTFIDFSKLELIDPKFQNTKIGRHNFIYLLELAKKRPISFAGLNMDKIDLRGVNLNVNGIENLALKGAFLDEVSLITALMHNENVNIDEVNIEGIKLLGEYVNDMLLGIQSYLFLDMQGIRMKNAICKGISFFGVDLSYSDLSGCDFEGAKLIACKMNNANLCGCNFRNAELFGCNFNESDLTDADMQGAKV